jgi:predicted phage terminase large subunit-like protein
LISLQLRAKAEQERRRRQGSDVKDVLSFREFIRQVNPGFKFYKHVDILIPVLQRVADGEISRLMLFMPPRHTKSELVSRLFTAYYLYRHPQRWVGLTSYGADLAYSLSRNARDNFARIGGRLRGDAWAVKQWLTSSGGGLWAAGVGGPITGKGFHLGVIDDPVKNNEDAASPTSQLKQQEWYGSTFYTRGEPGNAIVVVQTRWNENDLSGWLLAQEADEEPEYWHIVNLPAIAEETPQTFPETCTVEPDFRQAGEALCPERYPLAKLWKIARRIGSYFWNALFQQRPSAVEGAILKRHWWRFWVPAGESPPPVQTRLADGTLHEHVQIELPEEFDEVLQSWDMAFKETKTSDFVCGQVWAKLDANKFLLDQVLERMDIIKTISAVEEMSIKWPETNAKLVEDKANGPAVISMLRNKIPGLIAVEPDGSKESRVHSEAPEIESGNIYLPHPHFAPWVTSLINSAAAFPNAAHDDDVDAMTQALRRWNVGWWMA